MEGAVEGGVGVDWVGAEELAVGVVSLVWLVIGLFIGCGLIIGLGWVDGADAAGAASSDFCQT